MPTVDKPRVLYLSPYAGGGGSVALGNFTAALEPQHVEAHFLFAEPCSLSREMEGNGWPVHFNPRMRTVPRSVNPLKVGPFLAQDADCLRQIRKIVRDNGIQIIHQGCEAMVVGGLAAKILGIASTVQVIGMSIFTPRPLALVWAQTLRALFDQIYCAQDVIHDEFRDNGVPAGKVTILYNSVSPARVRKEAAGPNPWSGDAVRVGMVATADARKGAVHLVRAAAALRERWPDVHYHLIGTGADDNDYARSLVREAEQLGIADRFHFEGFVSDAQRRIAHVDIMAQPSETEALALAQLEAMSLGKPLVVSDAGGNVVAVKDGVNGLVVSLADAGSLARSIERLLSDSDERERMGEAGRKRVEEMFSLERNLPRLLESYRGLLS